MYSHKISHLLDKIEIFMLIRLMYLNNNRIISDKGLTV